LLLFLLFLTQYEDSVLQSVQRVHGTQNVAFWVTATQDVHDSVFVVKAVPNGSDRLGGVDAFAAKQAPHELLMVVAI